MKQSNSTLFANSSSLARNLRVVMSKKKEGLINSSDQIPLGGITVVFSFGDTKYVKITDGVKTVAELPKLDNSNSGGLTFEDTSMLPQAGKIPIFSPQGLLSTGIPQFPENAVPLVYLDLRIPEPPASGTYTLRSVNGAVSWVLA